MKKPKIYVWVDTVGLFLDLILAKKIYVWGIRWGRFEIRFFEKMKNIRVGGYGGIVLKFDFGEKTKNIRVGGYGGVVLKVDFSKK